MLESPSGRYDLLSEGKQGDLTSQDGTASP